MALIFDGDI